VVMASGGYPAGYTTGHAIRGLDLAATMDGVTVFHAGTRAQDGAVVTAGGRVLSVSATGPDIPHARARAYAAVGAVDFTDAHFRTDIAADPT
jgi:phosphoribosylamine---glycine ligase